MTEADRLLVLYECVLRSRCSWMGPSGDERLYRTDMPRQRRTNQPAANLHAAITPR